MRLLLDTHILLWVAESDKISADKVTAQAAALIDDVGNELFFSVASIWELSIKHGVSRLGFLRDPKVLRRSLVDNGYVELAVTADHALAVIGLPHHHKDPFDRLLIAQATVENLTLMTADAMVARYPGPILKV